jgi:hypothetical protein
MIELPLDNTPSKEFSVSTPIGVLRFKTQWDSFLGQWFTDIISPTGETWLNRVALTAGTDNLLDGCGIPELRDCAMFAIDTKDVGVKANATVTVAHEITNLRNVVKYSPDGYVIWGTNAFDGISKDIAVLSGDHFCVSHGSNDTITGLGISGDREWTTYVGLLCVRGLASNPAGTAIYTIGSTASSGYNVNIFTAHGVATGGFLVDRPTSTKYAICVDSSGNFYTGGAGSYNVNKYDSSGVRQWSYTTDDVLALQVDGSGNVYAGADGRLVKIDSAGSLVWEKTSVGTVRKVAVDASGNVHIVGGPGSGGRQIRKYDSAGTFLWSALLSGGITAYGVCVASDGTVYVSSEDDSSGNTLFAYDSSGSLLWSRKEGTKGGSMVFDSFGNIIVTDMNKTIVKSLSIGSVTYSFKDTLSTANDVKIGTTNAETMQNLIAAINGSGVEGTNYGTGTVANPAVLASPLDTDTTLSLLLTAKTTGISGNTIALFQSEDELYTFPMLVLSGSTTEYGNDHGGNHKLDLFNDIGKTYRVFMTFPGDTVINPFTTTF